MQSSRKCRRGLQVGATKTAVPMGRLGWGMCQMHPPPPSYPSAHSEAPVKPQIENTGRRERVLPSAQMDAKFLCPHKLGPAPAADSGSSGPHSTGKAEPGSGKALAVRGGSIQF